MIWNIQSRFRKPILNEKYFVDFYCHFTEILIELSGKMEFRNFSDWTIVKHSTDSVVMAGIYYKSPYILNWNKLDISSLWLFEARDLTFKMHWR